MILNSDLPGLHLLLRCDGLDVTIVLILVGLLAAGMIGYILGENRSLKTSEELDSYADLLEDQSSLLREYKELLRELKGRGEQEDVRPGEEN